MTTHIIRKVILSLILGCTFITAGAQDANYYITAGNNASTSKQYDLAISNYNSAINIDRNSYIAYNNRAIAYWYKGEFGLAIADCNSSIRVNPNFRDAYINRGNAYYSRAQYELAITDFSKAVSLDSRNVNGYISRGNAYYANGLYNLAIKDMGTALSLDNYNVYAYFSRAYAYTANRQYKQAIADYSQAIYLSPNYTNAYYNRGMAYSDTGLYDMAIADYNTLIGIDPNFANVYNARGYAYWYKERFTDAIADYSRALITKPDLAETYNARGLAYNDNGQYELAVADFKKAIELDEKFSYPYINIIAPLARLHRFRDAAMYYKSYQDKGLVTYIEDQHWTFFKKYAEAISTGVNNADYLRALVVLEESEKQYSNKIDGGSAQLLKRSFASILALKGYVLEQLLMLTEAKQTYEQALVINPSQPDVKEALVKLEVKKEIVLQQDKKGPEIELISPQPSRSFDIVSDNDSTQIIGKAKDESGIAAITINDKTVDKTEEDGLFICNFVLKPGPNEINIVATDKQGNSSTRIFTINGAVAQKADPVVDAPVISEIAPKYYAIMIAEKDYQDPGIPNLQNPVKDANELKEILQNQYTFNEVNIDTLYNRSREDIMQTIVQRCNTLTSNDNLIIFYAGHGTAIKDQFGDIDGYWIPVTAKRGLIATYISAL